MGEGRRLPRGRPGRGSAPAARTGRGRSSCRRRATYPLARRVGRAAGSWVTGPLRWTAGAGRLFYLSSSLPSTSGCDPRLVTRWDPRSTSPAHRCRRRRRRSRPRERCCAPGSQGTAGTPPRGEAGGPPEPYTVQSTGDCRPGGNVRAVTGGLVADLAYGPPVPLTHEADLAGTRTLPLPAQATCSLRRGGSRSTLSVSTTKVNGSAGSAAGRPAIAGCLGVLLC